MSDLSKIWQRHIQLMQQTCDTIGHVVAGVDQATATTLRDRNDGPKGWTVLEVLCHLRDADGIFRARAQQMLDEEVPALYRFDHEALAVERAYTTQDLRQVCDEFTQSRQKTIALFEGVAEAHWERAGIHPLRGHFTMTDAVMQVGTHDVTHLEQITRILREKR